MEKFMSGSQDDKAVYRSASAQSKKDSYSGKKMNLNPNPKRFSSGSVDRCGNKGKAMAGYSRKK
jgi:hypothetical protein